jgi:hypothetical protein
VSIYLTGNKNPGDGYACPVASELSFFKNDRCHCKNQCNYATGNLKSSIETLFVKFC